MVEVGALKIWIWVPVPTEFATSRYEEPHEDVAPEAPEEQARIFQMLAGMFYLEVWWVMYVQGYVCVVCLCRGNKKVYGHCDLKDAC